MGGGAEILEFDMINSYLIVPCGQVLRVRWRPRDKQMKCLPLIIGNPEVTILLAITSGWSVIQRQSQNCGREPCLRPTSSVAVQMWTLGNASPKDFQFQGEDFLASVRRIF